MSQNRDQRYPTAAAMRAALNGTGEGATLVGKTEAATVLFERPASTIADASGPTARVDSKGGETTVVRSTAGTGQRRVAPWAIGAAALVLIGIVFGGFYAYQHRKNSNAATAPDNSGEQVNVNSSNAASSPAVKQAANEPSSGALKDAKKIVIANHPATANEPVKKNQKTARNNENDRAKSVTVGDVTSPTPPAAEQYPGVNTVPNMPDIAVPNISPRDRRTLRRLGGTTVRTLPDGTQVMTLPDGTRVVTQPNGVKRVIGPGQRFPRRRGLR